MEQSERSAEFCCTPLASFAVSVPALSEVDSQVVRPVQSGDILQVGRAEHSDDAIGAAAKNEALADRQTARRRGL